MKTTVATKAGTSANPIAILGAHASILKNYDVVKKFIEGEILPLEKAATSKLEIDQVILRLFQGIGEVTVLFQGQSIFLFLYFLDGLNFLQVMVLASPSLVVVDRCGMM